MALHALSKKAHAQIKSHAREELLSKAMESWKKTLVDAASRKIAIPKLSSFLRNYPDVKETIFRCHLHGGRSRNAYAATHQLLTVPQANILIKFIIEMGEKGFPLTYKKISEYALAIICADGSALPPVVIFPGELLRSNWLQKNPLEAK